MKYDVKKKVPEAKKIIPTVVNKIVFFFIF